MNRIILTISLFVAISAGATNYIGFPSFLAFPNDLNEYRVIRGECIAIYELDSMVMETTDTFQAIDFILQDFDSSLGLYVALDDCSQLEYDICHAHNILYQMIEHAECYQNIIALY